VAVPQGGIPVYNPATGKVETHAPAVASEQIQRGAVRPVETTIRVARGNEVREADASELSEAEANGWALVDDRGVHAARVRAEEDTLLGQAQGVAEAGASGLTFGLSDLALREMGADPERMRARSDAAGEVGESARLAGEVLPVLLSGGAAGAARGGAVGLGKTVVARAGALPRLVEGAGLLAERGVTRALGTGLGGRTAGMAARGAVEGFASGVGQEIHESVLGEREITAERALASGGMAALFGGGVGAAFPITGAGISKVGSMGEDAVRKVLGAAEGMGPSGSIIGDMASTIASGKRAGPVRDQLELLAKDNPKLHRVLHDQDAVVEEIGTRVRSAAESYGDAQRRGVAAFERDRAGAFGDLLGDTGDGQVARFVLDDVDAAIARLDEHLAVAEVPEFRSNFDQMALKKTRAPLALLKEGATGMSASQGYQELVKGLRDTQEQLTRLRTIGKSPDTVDMLVDVERMLKDSLTSPKYGGAARAFKEVADADAAYYAVADKMGNTSVGRLLNRGKQATNADAEDVVKRYADFKNTDRIDAARKSIDADIHAMERRVAYSKSPEMSAALDDMRAAREQMLGAMDEAAENAQILGRQKEMGRSPMSGVLSAMGPSGAAIVGSLLGGPIGAAIGGGLAMMARPGSAIRTLSAIKHAADSAGLKIDGIVKAVTATKKAIASAGKASGGAAGETAGRKTKSSRRDSVPRAVAALGARGTTREEDQRQRHRRAAELADPATLERELAQEMFALSKSAPGVSGVMSERIALGAQFLASKLPPEVPDPITGAKRVLNPETRDKFDRYHEAVTDPMRSLERLRTGTMTLEHAEALREVWPSLYADVRDRVMDSLQEAADKGETIPYTSRASLGVLFSMPSVPEMTREHIGAMASLMGGDSAAQNAAEDAEQQDRKTPRTRKVDFAAAENTRTPFERRQAE
jgi:hypothetical protein